MAIPPRTRLISSEMTGGSKKRAGVGAINATNLAEQGREEIQ